MKKALLFGVLLSSFLLLGCLSEATAEDISVVCRAVAVEAAIPAEYSCSFSNSGAGSAPVCVNATYSDGTEAAKICATLQGQDTVTKTSVLAEAPASCVDNGEFTCGIEYDWELIQSSTYETSEDGHGEEATEEAEGH